MSQGVTDDKIEMVAKSAIFVFMAMGCFLVYVFMIAPAITPQLQIGFAVGVFLLLEGTFLMLACNAWAISRGIKRWYHRE